MNNTNNYFSEDEHNNDIDENENNEESSDDSMDEETRQIIFKSAQRDIDWSKLNVSAKNKQPLIKKHTRVKSIKTTSLIDFVKKVDNDEKEKKPKKFTSKRLEDKKKVDGIINNDISIKTRTFNPRLPPYNFINKKQTNDKLKTIDFKNDELFPSL